MKNEEEYPDPHEAVPAETAQETATDVADENVNGPVALEEPEATSEKPVQTYPFAVLGVIVGTLLIASGGVWVMTHHVLERAAPLTEQTPLPLATPTPSLALDTPPTPELETVTFPREGFATSLPEGWRAIPPALALPTAIQNATHAFALPGTACTIVYAQLHTKDAFELLAQSAGYMEIKNGDQLLGRIERRQPLEHTSASSTDIPHSNSPYLPHEFAFSYQPLFYDNGSRDATRNAFVLFAPDNSTVAPTCVSDFVSLVASTQPNLQDYTLHMADRGVLTIERDAAGTDLLFRASSTGQLYRVAHLSQGAIVQPTMVEDTLFYIHNSGALFMLPLFGGGIPGTLPLPLDSGERVNDFVVMNDTIEYLRGAWCRSAPEECSLTHESFDRLTYSVTTLETEVSTPTLDSEKLHTTTQSLALENGTVSEGPSRPEGITPNRIPITLP